MRVLLYTAMVLLQMAMAMTGWLQFRTTVSIIFSFEYILEFAGMNFVSSYMHSSLVCNCILFVCCSTPSTLPMAIPAELAGVAPLIERFQVRNYIC